jgi:hypothetical protein
MNKNLTEEQEAALRDLRSAMDAISRQRISTQRSIRNAIGWV